MVRKFSQRTVTHYNTSLELLTYSVQAQNPYNRNRKQISVSINCVVKNHNWEKLCRPFTGNLVSILLVMASGSRVLVLPIYSLGNWAGNRQKLPNRVIITYNKKCRVQGLEESKLPDWALFQTLFWTHSHESRSILLEFSIFHPRESVSNLPH